MGSRALLSLSWALSLVFLFSALRWLRCVDSALWMCLHQSDPQSLYLYAIMDPFQESLLRANQTPVLVTDSTDPITPVEVRGYLWKRLHW